MKKNKIQILLYGALLLVASSLSLSSCMGDLDRYPTNDVTSELVYSSFDGYKSVLAKVYGAYALTGNDGPVNKPDLSLGDEAIGDFIRCFFNLQSMTTEEAICTWTDNGIPDLNYLTWSSNNVFVSGAYYRSLYQITLANEFLRESEAGKVKSRGITGDEATEIEQFRNEVRFLRAFQYWVMLDLFGNPPFVDENTPLGTYLPEQIKRADLFKYIESELKEIEPLLKDPKSNEYGRADQAACWSLLARLYLNAKVYSGEERYTDAITYSKKVIDSKKYDLKPKYEELFMADNHLNNPEVILSINYDGQRTQNWGGLTYIINASFITTRSDVPGVNFQEYFGMGGLSGWYGNRSRRELSKRFDNTDSRKLFFGSKTEIENVGEFTEGIAVAKFRNVTSAGNPGSNFDTGLCDTDFPLFRLAEMKLILAEAVLRGGQGASMDEAITQMNDLRIRAFGNESKNYTSISLDEVLNERSRELYWEGFRRTDLVRYGLFTSSKHLWQWKGGVKDGAGVDDHFNLFPIPASDLMANPNLDQNDKY